MRVLRSKKIMSLATLVLHSTAVLSTGSGAEGAAASKTRESWKGGGTWVATESGNRYTIRFEGLVTRG